MINNNNNNNNKAQEVPFPKSLHQVQPEIGPLLKIQVHKMCLPDEL